MTENDSDKKKIEALNYHSSGRPGKMEVKATKPFMTSSDLAKAYTPGVAAPCLEIAKNPSDAYKYTAKGNLVAVISNGTAVLGLGNIGALAGKPVMEGKGILFKRFADIDVFDIEVDEPTVDGMVNIVKSLEPTFGGVNLEDIKAPECFEIEEQLIEKMNIPVFHDDQHGTAIIASAAFINAVEVAKKDIKKVKCVFSGAGAAAMSCARLFWEMGVAKENIIMCDSRGVIHSERKDGMNKYKDDFAVKTDARTLADAIKDSDVFIGLSARGVLTKDMVASMNKNPIIFAMANPEPEIYPHEVFEVRDDAIMATGRSDFPNQVNNVLGFPFIFRGALDVRAKKINMEMKLAAVHALASLAKEEVPEEVKMAYDNLDFSFGRDYLIPKPFDTRVLTRVSPAVANAAMESGVAQQEIADLQEYAAHLEARLGTSAAFMKSLRDNLKALNKKNDKKVRMGFAEGSNKRVLQAVKTLIEEKQIVPVLLGNKDRILKAAEEVGLNNIDEIELITPEKDKRFLDFAKEYFETKQRAGVTKARSFELMEQENYFGSMLLKKGYIDAFMNGPTLNYPTCFKPLMRVIGTEKNHKAAGIYILVFKNRVIFLADCTAQVDPSADDLSEIAASTASFYRKIMKKEPNIAFLSFSNFGSNTHPRAKKIKNAVSLTKQKYPDLICDGEMQADVSVNKQIMDNLFSFSSLKASADILIFPDLSSANISYKLLSQLSDTSAIGPILVPMNETVNILARTASVTEIINMSILTGIMSHKK